MKVVYTGHIGAFNSDLLPKVDGQSWSIPESYMTIGKTYDAYEKQGSYNTYYIVTDDLDRRIASDVCNFSTIEEWRDKQLEALLEK
jgi:hypothetical protein